MKKSKATPEGAKSMAAEVEALRQLDVPALIEKYRDLWGKEPRLKNREALFKRCAWKLQENRMGGLSAKAKEMLEGLIAEIHLPDSENRRTVGGNVRKAAETGHAGVGTVITRQWHDRTVTLNVLENGYELDGVVYKSLSAAANALTGSKWNGRLFWGLTTRRKA
jgi:hypothetical protein